LHRAFYTHIHIHNTTRWTRSFQAGEGSRTVKKKKKKKKKPRKTSLMI
jgi:hypothetical protein